jgi:hypothetical protein
MTRRAPLTSEGGWFHVVVKTWPQTAEALTKPWPVSAITTDLTWWADRFTPDRPSFAALAERWGVSKASARRLALTFDGVENVRSDRKAGTAWETTGNRLGTAWETTGSVPTPETSPYGTAWEPLGKRLGTAWETVHPENGAVPMPFVASQTTDSDNRQQTTVVLEASSTPETVVPLDAPPAAPPALGPADPATEPDWDALFEAVPLTYDEESDDGEAADGGCVDEAPNHAGVEAERPAATWKPSEAQAPPPDVPAADEARSDGAALLWEALAPGSLLTGDGCLPLESATQPPPATRKRKAPRPAPVGDVETLWEAWRNHGSVRGEPNSKRRGLLARAIEAHGLSAMVDLLDAAHTGDDRYWRFLQGATPESDAVYLSPETLLNGRLVERVERAAGWVEGGRKRHEVTETRAEARAEASTRSLATRATMAWDKTVVPHIGSRMDRLEAVMAAWGDSPKAEEARRAVLGGLREAQGLSAIGMATQFTRPALKRAFVRGFAAALGGTVSEAELLAVG